MNQLAQERAWYMRLRLGERFEPTTRFVTCAEDGFIVAWDPSNLP
ncbi:hypothetical protein [Methylobacterium sp. R2-1]|nr:hypothetical protein [Methylobacterium sp. R2-1]MBB2961434.1 DNA-directed RNA polymerase subunit M/transcription elongation factor TFIIS [Methylobacterium sp. R2-1]